MMKKLIILLVILAFFTMSIAGLTAIAPANVGPTTNFDGDVGVPTGKGFYVNDVLLLDTDLLEFTGTGTLNGLDAVDATGENTIEALIFDADADTVLGVWEWQDDINLVFGNDADWAVMYDEDVDDQLIFLTAQTAAGAVTDPLFEIIVGGSPSAGQQIFGVAKGTQDSNTSLFTVDDDGDVLIPGTLGVTGAITGDVTGDLTGNADTVTTTDNEAANEENEVPFVADAAGPGDAALESDSGFTYNPSTGVLTAAGFAGDITGALTGNADTVTVDATTTDSTCFILLGEDASGSLEPQTDATLTYAADTGLLFATIITGEIRLEATDASPDTTGEIRFDSSVADITDGALAYYDGTTIQYVVSLAAADIWSSDDYVVTYDAGNDKFYMKEDTTSAGNFILHLMDVDAASTAYVHVAITGTGSGNDVSTAITNPDYGRNITVTCTNNNSPSGNVTITGTTADGTTSATDVITISAGATAQGVKAFTYVSNINVPAGVPAEDEVTIGIGDVIGLQNAISAEADMYLKTVDGVEEYGEISGNGNTTYNTLDCATIVQNEDITIYYHN